MSLLRTFGGGGLPSPAEAVAWVPGLWLALFVGIVLGIATGLEES